MHSCMAANPKNQFILSKTPPRLSGKKVCQVRSFSKKALLILELYSEAVAEDEEDDREFNPSTSTRLQPDETSKQEKRAKAQSDDNVCLLATNLLERIATGTLDVVHGTDQLFSMMRTIKYEE